MPKNVFDGITVVLIETRAHVLAKMAIDMTVSELNPGSVMVFTDKKSMFDEFCVVEIPKITHIKQYNELIIERLANYVSTDYALVIQYDGFVLNKDKFCDEFYSYDYIGAVWPNFASNRVGNGGFSLRSKRLIQEVAELAPQIDLDEPEDLQICRRFRSFLEKRGLRFAPETIANMFSFEEDVSLAPDTFGFHGLFHLPIILDSHREFLINNMFKLNETNPTHVRFAQVCRAVGMNIDRLL